MKILAITEDYLPVIGGSVSYLHNLCKAFASLGHEVYLVTVPQDDATSAQLDTMGGYQVLRLALPSFVHGHARITRRVFARILKANLAKLIAEIVPDIVHVMYGHHLGLAFRGKTFPMPVVWTIFSVPPSESGLSLFRQHPLLHACLERVYCLLVSYVNKRRLHEPWYDLILCPSGAVKNDLLTREIPAQKIKVIPGAVDDEFLTTAFNPAESRAKLEISGSPVFLTVAGFIYHKGLHVLIEAVSQVLCSFPEATFDLVGSLRDVSYFRTLQNQIRRRGLQKHVRLTPDVSRHDLLLHYAACDYYIQPSLAEGFCIAALEALAQGKLIAGCRVGGITDILLGSAGGVSIAPGQPDQIVAAVQRIVTERCTFPAPAELRRYVAENFAWDGMARQTLAAYSELLARTERVAFIPYCANRQPRR